MRHRGFTLLELLCVLAIGAVLMALAMPAWRRPLAAAAVRAAASQALSGLALARRTALASGEAVTLCLTADMTHCDLAGREWMLFRNQEGGSLAPAGSRRDGAAALAAATRRGSGRHTRLCVVSAAAPGCSHANAGLLPSRCAGSAPQRRRQPDRPAAGYFARPAQQPCGVAEDVPVTPWLPSWSMVNALHSVSLACWPWGVAVSVKVPAA